MPAKDGLGQPLNVGDLVMLPCLIREARGETLSIETVAVMPPEDRHRIVLDGVIGAQVLRANAGDGLPFGFTNGKLTDVSEAKKKK